MTHVQRLRDEDITSGVIIVYTLMFLIIFYGTTCPDFDSIKDQRGPGDIILIV